MSAKHTPFVSVVVPALNEEKYLPNLLESLKKQTYKNFEIIVADNNSTDHTAEIAKQYGAKVVEAPTKGVAAARQAGTKASTGEIIIGTDADAIVPPDWIARLVEVFVTHPDVAVCGGMGKLYSGPLDAKLITKYFLYPFAALDRLTSGGWNFAGFNVAFRKAAFDKTQGYNTSLQMAEDHDISVKLRKVGRALFLKDVVVEVSGRRFKKGFFPSLFATYIVNFLYRVVLRKEKTYTFEPMR